MARSLAQVSRGVELPSRPVTASWLRGEGSAVVSEEAELTLRRQRFSGRWTLTRRRGLGVAEGTQIGSRDRGGQSRANGAGSSSLSRGCPRPVRVHCGHAVPASGGRPVSALAAALRQTEQSWLVASSRTKSIEASGGPPLPPGGRSLPPRWAGGGAPGAEGTVH